MAIEKPAEREITRVEPVCNRPQYKPGLDVLELPDELKVLVDVPGTRAEDVDIQLENGTLTLHAKVRDREPEETKYHAQEYGVGDYHRTLQVSEIIDAARISADYENGVLTLHLPKTEAVKPRKIEVKAN